MANFASNKAQVKFGLSTEKNHDHARQVRSLGRKARFGYPKRNAGWEWQPPKQSPRDQQQG